LLPKNPLFSYFIYLLFIYLFIIYLFIYLFIYLLDRLTGYNDGSAIKK